MSSGVPAHPRACKAWYMYQAATIQCLLTLVELLLMFRGTRHSYSWCHIFHLCPLCSVQSLQKGQICSCYPYRLGRHAVCRHGCQYSSGCSWPKFISYMCLGRATSRSDLCCVRHLAFVVYLVTESRTSISTITTNWCILGMILWRCARSAWLEPESYARVMVRDSICTVIAVTGMRGLLLCSAYVHPRLGSFISLIFMLKSLTGQNILFQ
jgi:hypothetical protein